jgi:hypothetical protein
MSDAMMVDEHCVSPWMAALAGVTCAGKINPCPILTGVVTFGKGIVLSLT